MSVSVYAYVVCFQESQKKAWNVYCIPKLWFFIHAVLRGGKIPVSLSDL